MIDYIIFDNERRVPDRYTIVDRRSGDVFAACEQSSDAGITGRYCGNCADHRVILYGSGWRQMPLTQKIVAKETNNYIRNAQLNPGWLGKELHHQDCPANLLAYIATLDKMASDGPRHSTGMPYIGPEDDELPSKPAMAR